MVDELESDKVLNKALSSASENVKSVIRSYDTDSFSSDSSDEDNTMNNDELAHVLATYKIGECSRLFSISLPSSAKQVSLCIYRINNSYYNNPFLEFLVIRRKVEDKRVVGFPYVSRDALNTDKKVEDMLYELSISLKADVLTRGFFMVRNITYMLCHITGFDSSTTTYRSINEPSQWVTSGELVLGKILSNVTVSPLIELLVKEELALLTLYKKNRIIKSPDVYYIGGDKEYVTFISSLIMSSEGTRAPLDKLVLMDCFTAQRLTRYKVPKRFGKGCFHLLGSNPNPSSYVLKIAVFHNAIDDSDMTIGYYDTVLHGERLCFWYGFKPYSCHIVARYDVVAK